jgi:hypothetical protein
LAAVAPAAGVVARVGNEFAGANTVRGTAENAE